MVSSNTEFFFGSSSNHDAIFNCVFNIDHVMAKVMISITWLQLLMLITGALFHTQDFSPVALNYCFLSVIYVKWLLKCPKKMVHDFMFTDSRLIDFLFFKGQINMMVAKFTATAFEDDPLASQ